MVKRDGKGESLMLWSEISRAMPVLKVSGIYMWTWAGQWGLQIQLWLGKWWWCIGIRGPRDARSFRSMVRVFIHGANTGTGPSLRIIPWIRKKQFVGWMGWGNAGGRENMAWGIVMDRGIWPCWTRNVCAWTHGTKAKATAKQLNNSGERPSMSLMSSTMWFNLNSPLHPQVFDTIRSQIVGSAFGFLVQTGSSQTYLVAVYYGGPWKTVSLDTGVQNLKLLVGADFLADKQRRLGRQKKSDLTQTILLSAVSAIFLWNLHIQPCWSAWAIRRC
jgi:hypothetical protein